MADTLIAAFLTKAKIVGGPIVAGILLGMSAGWYARGERSTAINLAATVARLDSNTVKRPEFDALVVVVRQSIVRGDSTNALLKRFICVKSPTICP